MSFASVSLMLLSPSLGSAIWMFFSVSTLLHLHILSIERISTCWEYLTLYTLTATGKTQAPWPMRPPTVIAVLVRVPPNLFRLWMNLTLWRLSAMTTMLLGSLVREMILSLFKILVSITVKKASSSCLLSHSCLRHKGVQASCSGGASCLLFSILFTLLMLSNKKAILGSGAPDKRNNEDFVAREKPFVC